MLIAPLLLTMLAPPPTGFGSGARNVVLGIVMLALLLTSARLTDNRVVWVALAVVFATASALAAWRWHASLVRAPLRWLSPLFALMIVLGVVFADVTRERALQDFPPQTTVAQTLADDPRLMLWDRTAQLVRERPWTGFGFGRGDRCRPAQATARQSDAVARAQCVRRTASADRRRRARAVRRPDARSRRALRALPATAATTRWRSSA